MKLKVLIDTNVLIHSEDNKIIDLEIQKFHRLSTHYDIFIHQKTFLDIENDSNKDRKNITKAKIGKYNLLNFRKEPDEDFYLQIERPKKSNDFIDDNLLFTIQK